jgi:hypothetical protein
MGGSVGNDLRPSGGDEANDNFFINFLFFSCLFVLEKWRGWGSVCSKE